MDIHSEADLLAARGLVTELQASAEADKTVLRQALHDELGGLMVSTAMDLSSASKLLEPSDRAQEKLARAKLTLQRAIDRSRSLVEQLRPSILDNIGLFAALQRHRQESCRGRGVVCTHSFPEIEPPLAPAISISLFRIAEEVLAMAFKQVGVKATHLQIRVEDGLMWMTFTDDGDPLIQAPPPLQALDPLESIRHRVRQLRGSVDSVRRPNGTTVLTTRVPLNEPSNG